MLFRSLGALRLAGSLAVLSKAQLTVLSVVEWPEPEVAELARFDDRDFRVHLREQVRQELATAVATTLSGGTVCEELAYGQPYRRILHVAERDNSDLIVMGVRGRNPFDLAIFGSTANQVVRRARCPVLTYRP